ncbi:3-hydroxyisobutyrate dehydrogenase [Rhodothalassium salexigens]|nr:3-hydroxyisobutyrate dehydrogenase [Rhodothalassium salexigens]MBK5910693.1 3-hydroxyisobutyrate dehydrogenase [Rhodothalassium salexigens]
MTTIAFIGLGRMGLPMARNLIKAGHRVRGLDLSADALARFEAAGGQPARDLAQAVQDAEAVVTMLPQGSHVRAVYLGADGGRGIVDHAAERTQFIDCSTIDVETAAHVGAETTARGFNFVDAPVSGGVGGAEAGTLTFMVGGTDLAFSRAKPLLESMGRNVVHAGAAGTGQAAKMCNNMLLAISMIGTAEAFALADKLGLDRQRLFDIASTASGQCWSLTSYCPVPGPVPASPANRDYAPGFAIDLMSKDLHLALDAADRTGAETPLGAAARGLYDQMRDEGHGGLDFSAIFKKLSKDL